MATKEELEKKIDKFEVNMTRTDRIVNGTENEDVIVDDGQLVPSIRKWQKEMEEEYGIPSELVTIAEEAASAANDSADRAETARDAAFVNADVYPNAAAGIAAVAVGEQFQTELGLEMVRWEKTSESPFYKEVARYPSAKLYEWVKSSSTPVVAARSAININTVSRTINISGIVRVLDVGGHFTIPTQVVPLPSTSSPDFYWIVYSREDSLVSVKTSAAVSFSDIYLGSVVIGSSGAISPWLRCIHTIDGRYSEYQRRGVALQQNASAININTTSGNLEIANNVVRIIADSINALVSAQSVPLPSSTGFYRVEYNTLTSLVEIRAVNTTQLTTSICWGYLGASMSGTVFELIGVPKWTLNGVAQGGGGGSSSAATVGQMVPSAPEDINFDFASGQIVIANNLVRLIWDNSTRLLPAETISLSGVDSRYWYRLSYDTGVRTFAFSRLTVPLPAGSIQVALFNTGTTEVDGVPSYVINGEQPSGGTSTMVDADFLVAAGDFEPDYDQPTLPDYSTERLAAAGNYNNIYTMYDALQVDYPGYITSETLGQDALGNDIRCWHFKPETPRDLTIGTRKPKVVLVSGVHGSEQSGIWNVYFTMREICEQWREDKKLEALRWGTEFVVVPVAVPTAFNAFTRKNHNGVDIARNFPTGWVLGSDPDASTYGGLAPLDQAEAVILNDLMAAHRDAVYFGSHHNFSGSTETQGFIWNASATEFGMRLANRLISIVSIKAQQRYPYLPQDDDFFLGYTNDASPNGSEGLHAAVAYGINAGTFEISMRWDYLEPRPSYGSEVATVGVETLVNWMLLNVRHGADLVNSKVRL